MRPDTTAVGALVCAADALIPAINRGEAYKLWLSLGRSQCGIEHGPSRLLEYIEEGEIS